MPNLLNSVKKVLNSVIKDKITVDGVIVPYFEGFAPEKAMSSNLVFTAANISVDKGSYDSKTRRGYRLIIPIYANYRGEKSPINDKFAQDIYKILYSSLNVGALIDNYCIKMCAITSSHVSMQDAGGNFIQNVLTCTIEVSEN